jgi:NarL family two-component system response regulator LiaR
MFMSESKLIKVMIVDDHPVVRNGLKAMLLAMDDIELAGEAGSGRETLALCRKSLPDVILMDMVMPGMDGLETTRAVLDQYPKVKIIVLTSFPEQELVQKAMAVGASGYLYKNTAIDALPGAIRAAYAGQSVLAPEATAALIQTSVGPPKLGHDLSAREREVLTLLVEGLSNDEIAERLVISPFTVKNHIMACIAKLGAANRTQAAALAVKHQLVP